MSSGSFALPYINGYVNRCEAGQAISVPSLPMAFFFSSSEACA